MTNSLCHKRSFCHHSCHRHTHICQHQMEIEVWPPEAEVYFLDERFVDPVNTQVRFNAEVYNSPSVEVIWSVTDINGGKGAGTIDSTGLYLAPKKVDASPPYPHGLTDIIVATIKDDPMRCAYAKVVLIGYGPEPIPVPSVEVYPRVASLYYVNGADNDYIDPSNKIQQFRTIVRNSWITEVEWKKLSGPGDLDPDSGIFKAPQNGPSRAVAIISANIKGNPSITGEATVILLNYNWPWRLS